MSEEDYQLLMQMQEKRKHGPHHQAALEMDETLTMTAQMKNQVESLQQRQKELASKMKQRRKLEQEHAHTISSLDAALAAQEEYRKGYHSVRKAFMKAKEDLKDMTKAFQAKTSAQRERSKAVLDRMVKGTEVTMAMTALENWKKYMEETATARAYEKAQAETAEEVAAIQKRMAEFQEKKKGEAKAVLDRMAAGQDQGLVNMTFSEWKRDWEEWKFGQMEAAAMKEKLDSQKAGARRTLEKNLGLACAGVQASAWRDWLNHYLEEKKVNELMGKADAAMARYKAKKKGESCVVVDRMSKEKNKALLDIIFIIWIMQKELDKWAGNYEDEKELLKGFIAKQKARSKEVIDRMVRGQSSGVTKLAFDSWKNITWDNAKARANEKAFSENAEELDAMRARMADMEAKSGERKDAAKEVLNRMNAASTTGLLSLVFVTWMRDWEEEVRVRKQGEALNAQMQKQKAEARRVLEKNLGMAMSGVMGSAFQDWKNFYIEERQIRELKGDAEKQLNAYKSKKKAESMGVVGRMTKQKDQDLKQLSMLVWFMGKEMDKLMGNYLDEKELLKAFIDKQKAKAKGVVDRMIRGNDSGILSTVMSGWVNVTWEGRQARAKEAAQKETMEEMNALQAQMKEWQEKKKGETKAVLDRMTAASDQGLVAMTFGAWLKDWEEIQAQKEEAKKMHDLLAGQKEEARRVLEKSLGSAMGAVVASSFNDWVAYFDEQQNIKALKGEADKKMKAYKQSKKDQSVGVVDRMSQQQNHTLLIQCMIVWKMQQELNVLNGYIEKQKKKSKNVLDNMSKGHDSAKMSLAWTEWTTLMQENEVARANERAQRETSEEMNALKGQMEAFKNKKKDETMSVMERMHANSEQGLISLTMSAWKQDMEEIYRQKEEAAKLDDVLKTKKAEARRVLEKNLGSSMGAVLASAFNDWMNSYLEERNVRELRDDAERKMKAYAKEKKGQSMIMVDRMAKSKDKTLLQQSMLIWRIGQDLDRVMGNYLEEKELLKAFINKQKEKSKTVVDRMMKGNDSARYSMAWQSWVQDVQDNRQARLNEKARLETQGEVDEITKQMNELKARKRGDALKSLESVAATQETGLVSLMFQNWKQDWEISKKQYEEAEKLNQILKSKKGEARRVLEKNLGQAVMGLQASVFNDWLNSLLESKMIKGMQQDAERMMKSYKDKKKDEATGLVGRMTKERTAALVQQVFMVWVLSIAEMIRTNALQAELKHIIDLHANMELSMKQM